jgi:phage/plasmid-associated DNA primase
VIFEGLQGAGKNLHLKPIRNIVGQRYFIETANIEDILGKHAEGYLNKLWVVLNELEGKDSMDFEGTLKSFITEDKKTVNVKFQRPADVNNYCNLIITTNKKNCIRIDVVSGNRRWCAFRATDKYSNKKAFHNKSQWEQIAKSWENPIFLRCLYYYLTVMNDGTKYNFKIPHTEALKTLIRYSRPHIYYWLESYLNEKMQCLSFLRDNSKFNGLATELYNHYKEWCEQSQPDHVLSNQKFKNSIHELGIGIDFFKDTGLNQNTVEFEYKTVYENFSQIYTNKYETEPDQKPNDLVLYTSYDDIPDDYTEESKQAVVEPEPVVEEKKVKIKKVRQDRTIQQATESIQKQIQKNIESRVNSEN